MDETPLAYKFKKLNIPLYECDVVLIVGPRPSVLQWAKKNVAEDQCDGIIQMVKNSESSTLPQGTCFPMKSGASIIWLPENYLMHTFVHEISHAAYNVLKAKGIRLCDETDEVYAYLVEYIYKKLTEVV